jgi:Zn-dependent protease with chaperone function
MGDSSVIRQLCVLALVGLVLPPAASPQSMSRSAEAVTRAEALIDQARELGLAYTNRNDNKARDAARRTLDEAQKLLKQALERDAACEKCYEHLAAAHFYRASFRFTRNFDDCIEVADKGLARFPANATLAFFKGYAHYNEQDFAGAAKSLNRYLLSNAADPQLAAEARQLRDASRQRVLAGWYNQGDFYQSRESRIEVLNPQTARNEVVLQITPEYELSLGQQAFTQISGTAPAVQDPELIAYLQQLVKRLTDQTPGPRFSYSVSVINSPEVNAVTPPGHIIVYTGLLSFVETESELAGVLAHELAHNYGHHVARRLIKAYHAQNLANAITRAVNPQGTVAQAVTQIASNLGLGLFLNAYSRFEESEADRYGAHILYNAGYNPTAMSGFFVKMYGRHPKQPIKFLSTHPPMPDRADTMTDYLESFPLETELALDSETFKRIVKQRYPSAASPTQGPGGMVLPPAVPRRGPPQPAAPPPPGPGPTGSTPAPTAPPPQTTPPSQTAAAPTSTTGEARPAAPVSASDPRWEGRPASPPGSEGPPPAPAGGTPPRSGLPPPSAPEGSPAPPAGTPSPGRDEFGTRFGELAAPRPPPPSPSAATPPGPASPSSPPAVPSQPEAPGHPARVAPPPAPSIAAVEGRSADPPSAQDCGAARAALDALAKLGPTMGARASELQAQVDEARDTERRLASAGASTQAAAKNREFLEQQLALVREQQAYNSREALRLRAILNACDASVLRTPAPSAVVATSGTSGRVLGIWGPAGGGLQVAFRETDGVVVGIVRALPPTWSTAHVKPGDTAFLEGRREGNLVRGMYINIPQAGECPILYPKYSTATITFDPSGETATLATNEYRYWSGTCRWSDVYEARTYTWRRIE